MRILLLAALTFSICAAPVSAASPIIDVHKHASRPGSDDAEYRDRLLDEMDDESVPLALLHINEPSDLEDWVAAAPERFVAGPMFPCPKNRAEPLYDCFAATGGWPDLRWLEAEAAAGRIGLLGEMLFVYSGVAPDDPRMGPYWELAARHDLPVSVHINRGPPPGAPNSPRSNPNCCPDFDSDLGNPDLLRPVLRRHPGLRIILVHVGAGAPPDHLPYSEETVGLLRDFPSVYLDMSILNSVAPPEAHEAELRRLIDAGFGDRILFGSDNLPVERITTRLNAIEWLSPQQRRAIYYDNAARFLRLDATTIARHHRDFSASHP